ncbi:MAG: aldo/keto reductase [Nocardiaceae bacterium]|nr:aldo/keto reductase [Nocardiaceae bacterium]
MKQRRLGRSGLRVSRLGLGTQTWGRETSPDEASAQLTAFTEAGGNLVDTSPLFARGRAQMILATLLDDVVPRESLVLSACSGDFTDTDPDSSRRALLLELDHTLETLGTDYLDIWQVAGWDPHTPVDELAQTLDYAITSGRVRYAALRDHRSWQLATVQARSRGVAATQQPFSLLDRSAETDLLPAAEFLGLGFFASMPLAGGVLTGKYISGVPADARAAVDPAMNIDLIDERTNRVVDAVLTAADGLATSPLAVALAWARDHSGVTSAIVGARDAAQLTGALAAESLDLPNAIAAALDDVSR